MIDFPKPCWVDLRILIDCDGQAKQKLVAKFDPTRGLLQIVIRQQEKTFDLSQIIAEHQKREQTST